MTLDNSLMNDPFMYNPTMYAMEYNAPVYYSNSYNTSNCNRMVSS